MAGFQYYPGMTLVLPINLLSLKYGFNLYGQYVLYRLDSFSPVIAAHDYSSQEKHATIATTSGIVNWDSNGIKITEPT